MASPQPKSDKAASFASRDDVDTQALQMLPPPYFNENGTSSTVEPTDSTVALARARYALGSLRRERNRRKTQATARAARASAEAGTISDPPIDDKSPEDREADTWLQDPRGRRPSMYHGAWPKTYPDGSTQYS
jgi:hypothetical protein